MIRRGDELRVGPIRILVVSNLDGRCQVYPMYGTFGALGLGGPIDEEILNRLVEEEGVTMRAASQKPKQGIQT